MTTKEEAVAEAIKFFQYILKNEPEKFEDEELLFKNYMDSAGFQSWMLEYCFENKENELTEEACKAIETEQRVIFEEALSIFNYQNNELEEDLKKLNNNLSNLSSKLDEWSNWLSDFSVR
jgi:predicted nuclease with TOPRIM domain